MAELDWPQSLSRSIFKALSQGDPCKLRPRWTTPTLGQEHVGATGPSNVSQ